jgi:DNA-binding transcriptional MerR regulator
MKKDADTASGSHTLNDLCALTGVSPRTARYYIQIGLLSRPVGETRAARYDHHHLEQLVRIRKWSEAGLSLERIRELLHDLPPSVPERAPEPGSVRVCSHVRIAPGIELVLDPSCAGLEPEKLRLLVTGVLELYRGMSGNTERLDFNLEEE